MKQAIIESNFYIRRLSCKGLLQCDEPPQEDPSRGEAKWSVRINAINFVTFCEQGGYEFILVFISNCGYIINHGWLLGWKGLKGKPLQGSVMSAYLRWNIDSTVWQQYPDLANSWRAHCTNTAMLLKINFVVLYVRVLSSKNTAQPLQSVVLFQFSWD